MNSPKSTQLPMNKRRFRRVAIGVVALAATVGLMAACSSNGGSSTGNGTTAPTRYSIIYIAALINDSFFVTQRCGAQDAAKQLGVDLKFQGPTTNDPAGEIKAFAAAAATNPDGMIVAPFTNSGFGGTVRPLMAKGIPVIATGQTLEPADAMATYITNYLDSAKPLVKIIGDISGGKGTIGLIASDTGNKTDSDRYTQLVPALKSGYPDLKILDPQYVGNDTAKSAAAAAALIQGNPDLSVIYATSGPEAVGAASAIKAAGVGARVKLVSFDSSPDQITLLRNNQLAATVGQSPYKAANLAVNNIVTYLNAHKGSQAPVPASAEITATPSMLLTPDNVSSAEGQAYQYMTACAGD
ncbi:MAG: hypothetical protein B5766_04975 [Candidatus Lumbricidophila eiseniae]|uniref:Periplasmic binding protein domain-containing protein n=1 Tax=Candidatus Lumbricidiphila eiseniae TaxID=1969409 RepID=A0A2A6FT02_9MICO|nr:MAG: hypothetical protein B5766_04975 [Candidatus Lumbricidophila eiseniae]